MKLYGSLTNRLEENKMFADEIKVGMGATKYSYTDRDAYEVTKVINQKNVFIRKYDHELDGEPMSNNWKLISNPDNSEIELKKRGKFWYITNSVTKEYAESVIARNDKYEKLDLALMGFDVDEIIATGKTKTKYTRINISFGEADYYYDYSF